MSTARNRTLDEKLTDYDIAFAHVQQTIVPDGLREAITAIGSIPVPTGNPASDGDAFAAYASLVQSTLHLARLVAAGDRAAAVVAAMLTQSGVARPTLDVIEGGEATQ